MDARIGVRVLLEPLVAAVVERLVTKEDELRLIARPGGPDSTGVPLPRADVVVIGTGEGWRERARAAAARQVAGTGPSVVLVTGGDLDEAAAAERLGLEALFVLDDPWPELIAAIRCTAAGGRYRSASLRAPGEPSPHGLTMVETRAREAGVTGRQWQSVRLAARGLSNKEIGVAIDISPETAKRHLGGAYKKLKLRNRWQLYWWMRENGE